MMILRLGGGITESDIVLPMCIITFLMSGELLSGYSLSLLRLIVYGIV